MLAAATTLARADIIVLKNGKRIVVDTAREKNGRIEYEIGDNSFAIPKTSVDHIESGIGTPTAVAPKSDIPEFVPSETVAPPSDLTIQVVRDGKLDVDALSALENGDPRNAGAAYFQAGRFEQEHGNRDKALQYFQRASRYQPDNNAILDHYAAVLIQLGRAPEAIPVGERSVRIAPNSADGLAVLGFAYFAADRARDAIRVWKKALEIRPDALVREYLDKAQREQTVEADFQQRESGHFTLRYEGKQVPERLSREMLAVLEAHYDDLVRELGVTPRNSIGVVLYTEQAFFDVTRAPGWIGAINDGKIRVPIEGVTQVTPELSRMLKHELTHSFINQASRQRCPQWLHEGIAQLMEGESAAPYGRTLARLYSEDHQVPLNLLEGSFMNLKDDGATIAYIEALAAVEYIRDTYGTSDLRRILERIGEGASTESALRSVLHSGYQQFEGDLGNYLKDRYGL